MTSIYQKIVTDITQAITNNCYVEGNKLPSIRQISKDYNCSKDTVQRALLELKYANLIYPVSKSGYYVLGKIKDKTSQTNKSIEDVNHEAFEDFKQCLTQAIERQENQLFSYYHKEEGLDELIQALSLYLSNNQVYSSLKNIMVTSGSQQALYILSQMPFPNGNHSILIEKPTYARMEHLLQILAIPYHSIERNFSGFDLKALETIFKTGEIKFFYTISRFSNPMGLSYSKEEKEKIVDLANRYNVYIIEDDYLGDFAKGNDAPIHYYDTNNRVIYLKSFSMTVFPSLRIAALALPLELQTDFIRHKALIDLDTNLIMQKALALYLSNGMFTKNVKNQIHYFSSNRSYLEAILEGNPISNDYRISPTDLIIQLPKKTIIPNSVKKASNHLINEKKAYYITFKLSKTLPLVLKNWLK
ncbi:aminotransferase-like domain-containing protein [Streptococcus hongkongensis]|nr:GntR family transcriptional regulator [Streptococcus uberis]